MASRKNAIGEMAEEINNFFATRKEELREI